MDLFEELGEALKPETMKHTKGKWIVHSGEGLKIKDIEENTICSMSFVTNFFRRDPEEVYANAKLISKAPEMLEAINLFINGKKSMTMGYYSDDQVNAIDKMKSLIKEIES